MLSLLLVVDDTFASPHEGGRRPRVELSAGRRALSRRQKFHSVSLGCYSLVIV